MPTDFNGLLPLNGDFHITILTVRLGDEGFDVAALFWELCLSA